MLICIFSGNVGRINSSSFFTASVTLRTFDFVCLTIPKPIASFPFALKKPLSVSAPITTLDTSSNLTFALSYFFNTIFLNSSIVCILDVTCKSNSLSCESNLPAGFSIFSLFMEVKISFTVIFLASILSGFNQILIAYLRSPPIVIDATPGNIDNLSTMFLSR